MRTLKIMWCLAGAVLLLQARAMEAQEALHLKSGDRVRATARDCQLRRRTGTLVSLENDLFVAALGEEDVRCPVESLTKLEVSKGRRHWWKAGFIGAGIVAVSGTLLAATADSPEGEAAGYIGLSTIILTPVGFIMGSLVGLIRGTDSWKEVDLPPVEPSLLVSGGSRLNLGFSIPLGRK